MRKSDLFQKPHFKGDDFPTARVMTITGVREVEVFIPNANAKEWRWVVDVQEDVRYVFLSESLFDNIATVTGQEDTDAWAGKAVQFYRVQVSVQGRQRWGIRARKAGNAPASKTPLADALKRQPVSKKPETYPAVLVPKRPYPPETLQKGFAQQLKQTAPAWQSAIMPNGVRMRVCIGFKRMFPDFSADEVSEARHSLCGYLCDGRKRLKAGEENHLTWADGVVLNKWLFTGKLNEEGHDTPCGLAAQEAHTILSFIGFFDDKPPEAEAFVEAAVQEAVEMMGAVVTEEAPPEEEEVDEAPF